MISIHEELETVKITGFASAFHDSVNYVPWPGHFCELCREIVGTFEKLVPDPAIQKVKIRLTIRRGICGAIPFNTDISELRPKPEIV